MIYILFFGLSGTFFYLASNTKRKCWKNFLIFCAIALPVFLGAFRGVSVGYDTSLYAFPTFRAAKKYSSFMSFIGYDGLEPGFLFLEYFGSKYLDSFPFVLGGMQLITIYSFYLTAKKVYGEERIAINMMIFYLFIYSTTYNAMRQSVAVALIMLATVFFAEKRYCLTFLAFLLAFLFHTSAIVGLIFFIVYYITKHQRLYYVFNLVIVGFSALLLLAWEKIFNILFELFTVLGSGKNYSDYLKYGKSLTRNETSIIFGFAALVIIYFYNKKHESRWSKMLFTISLIFLFYQPVGEKMDVVYRVLQYPQAFLIMVFPLASEIIKLKINGKEMKVGFDCIILLFFFLIWFYSVYLHNANMVLPYRFLGY